MKELDPPVQQLDHSAYAGRWIATIGDQIIGQGGTPAQALRAAQSSRYKEVPQITYVPPTPPLKIHPILEELVSLFPPDAPVFVVGGAVRDALLKRQVTELDFILPEKAIKQARKVADHFGGAFYVLDGERDYGRAMIPQAGDQTLVMDFAPFQGQDLEADLLLRDFTINAVAMGISPPYPIHDPLGGVQDLLARRLRACSPTAISSDPIRVLRGIRFSIKYDLRAEKETKQQMKAATSMINITSEERIRDELFKLLDSKKPAAAIQVLDSLGGLEYVLPELSELKETRQSAPHIDDTWQHTLSVVRSLRSIWDILSTSYDPDSTSNLFMGVLTQRLGRYRKQLADHLNNNLVPYRTIQALNILAALYHDSGKPKCQEIEQDGQARFINHEEQGAEIVSRRALQLHLSNSEIKRLQTIVRHHMRPLWLAQSGTLPSRRAKFRFFHDTHAAGVDICLLSLADTLGTYGHTLTPEIWKQQVDVVRELLEAWWEHKEEQVFPTPLIDGNELMNEFNLQPGPLIGRLIEELSEAQATGKVLNQRQAFEHINRILGEMENEQK